MEICILKLQSKEPGARSDQIQIPNLTVLVCMCLVLLLSDGLCKAATLWSAKCGTGERHYKFKIRNMNSKYVLDDQVLKEAGCNLKEMPF